MLIPAHGAREEYRDVVRSALIDQHRYSKLEAILACERHCALVETGFRRNRRPSEVAEQIHRRDRLNGGTPPLVAAVASRLRKLPACRWLSTIEGTRMLSPGCE
jgi:hypothetical protein